MKRRMRMRGRYKDDNKAQLEKKLMMNTCVI